MDRLFSSSSPPVRALSKKKLNLIQKEITVAYQSYESVLLRRALYKTSDIETSQDLVQTTFFKTILYLQKGGKIDLMRGFLNHILSDLIVDEYRKTKATSLDSLLEQGFEPKVDDTERLINKLDGKTAAASIAKLPEKYKQVIQMRYLNGLTLQEIAAITNQSENTVAVQVHRGLFKLKRIIETKLAD